mmetsp:Transcript_281/g.997  ORF Transcript_281/g.997 Transcript_281/m.997 type:complete len:239 (-) Transcript_281:3323-4039(-)
MAAKQRLVDDCLAHLPAEVVDEVELDEAADGAKGGEHDALLVGAEEVEQDLESEEVVLFVGVNADKLSVEALERLGRAALGALSHCGRDGSEFLARVDGLDGSLRALGEGGVGDDEDVVGEEDDHRQAVAPALLEILPVRDVERLHEPERAPACVLPLQAAEERRHNAIVEAPPAAALLLRRRLLLSLWCAPNAPHQRRHLLAQRQDLLLAIEEALRHLQAQLEELRQLRPQHQERRR